MDILPIKTNSFIPPKMSIYPELEKIQVKENDILVITSKIISIHQGDCISVLDKKRKNVILEEADYILDENFPLTIKNNLFVPFSGVDESNGNGHYILLPKNPDKLAKEISEFFCKKFNLENFGVLIIDSNCLPLRFGLIGTTVGFYGIKPIRDYENKKDIFNRELKMSRINVLDCIASMATLYMGQGNEKTPMVLIRDLENIEFENASRWDLLNIDLTKDYYSPFVELFKKN